MATDIQHENLDGIFRLWLNWVMVAGAISLLVILSLWLPPAAMPVLAIVFQIGFFMQVRANRRKKMPSCYILPFLATRIFFWTAVVMVAVLYLYSRHLIENIFDGDTINAEIPFITVLIIGPVAVAVTLFAVARGGRLRFCRDCKIRNGFPAERGFLGNLFSQEGTYQTRMLLNVSALVTLVGWVYYFLAYVNVNLNEPDRLVFFWTPLILFIITIVVMAVRYLGLCNYYEQHFEGSGQQMRRSTMLRYIIIADNTIVLRKPQSDPDMDMGFTAACYDTPASLVIPHRQSIPDDEAHTLFKEIMDVDADIRPMYVTDNGNADCNIFHYLCFLSEESAATLAAKRPDLEFATIYHISRLIDSKQTARLLSAEIYRLHTMAMAWKTYDTHGDRRYKIKHYQPTFRLRDVHKWHIDFNDSKWLSISEFNADSPFFRLRRFWKKTYHRQRMNTSTIIITGPTASGKTARAVALARRIGGEIISADSRQIYRGMDIGTGKDMAEYGDVAVHLVDIAPAGYKYNLFEYLRDATAAEADIISRGRRPIVCGGTGLYIESLLKGLRLPQVPPDEQLRRQLSGKSLEELTHILASMKTLHNVTDVDTPQRAIRAIEIQRWYELHPEAHGGECDPEPARSLIIGVEIDREARRKRIENRLRNRIDHEGMIEEVKGLLDSGISPDDLIYYGLEYKFVTLYLTGRISREEMFVQLLIAIHQFAKRQMTWFRGMERRGFTIHWLPYDLEAEEFTDRIVSLTAEQQ